MPLAEPTAEPERKPAKFDRPQILDIVRYVTSLAPTSAIPAFPRRRHLADANVAEGFSLFALNCAPCHTITGAGDALADGHPGAASARSDEDDGLGGDPDRARQHAALRARDALARTGHRHRRLRRQAHRAPDSPGGLSLGGVGPVAEGFVGLFVGVGACLLAALWVGDRTETDKEEDHGATTAPTGPRAAQDGDAEGTRSSPMPEETEDRRVSGCRRPVPAGEDPGELGPRRRAAVPGRGQEPTPGRARGSSGFLLAAAGFAGFGAAYWQNYSNFWLGDHLLRRLRAASATGWWSGAST